ncbi:MAG: hypothetical protein AAFX59_12505 [Pseudomonadota bacterium]
MPDLANLPMSTTGTDAAADTTKQILTLATAIIGLTVTFLDKFRGSAAAGETAPIETLWQIEFSWIAFGTVIFFGLWTLLAITGEVDKAKLEKRTPTAMNLNVRLPAFLTIIGFAAGMVFVIWAGLDKFG